jgi:hypothetical protein
MSSWQFTLLAKRAGHGRLIIFTGGDRAPQRVCLRWPRRYGKADKNSLPS